MSSTYPAEMFRPASGARASTGVLTVEAHQLRFVSSTEENAAAEQLLLPTRGLGCRLSGYDNRTFFFTHVTAEGAEVAVKDASIIQDPVLQGHTVFQEARRVGRATHRRFWGCVALLALGALMVLATVGTAAALLLGWLIGG